MANTLRYLVKVGDEVVHRDIAQATNGKVPSWKIQDHRLRWPACEIEVIKPKVS